jgi:DNA-binding protein YbaB
MDRPDWSRLHSMMDDIRRSIGSLDETQRQLSRITGTGSSADKLIRAVVGPRGQLVDLEIDPRVFRNPDSRGLADAILAAVEAAVADASTQSSAVLDRAIPPELRRNATLSEGEDRLGDLVRQTDAQLHAQGGTDG